MKMTRKLWYGMTNQLMFKSKSVILPSHTETQDMAQQFAQFFNDKIERIRDEISHNQGRGSPDEKIGVNPAQMDSFAPVSEGKCVQIIFNSNSKYCTLHPIPTSLIKSCLDTLLATICRIVNLSLQTSCIPDNFRHAIVNALIKKAILG